MVYEFYTTINDGVIKIPNKYKNKTGKDVKVTISDRANNENPLITAMEKLQKVMVGKAEELGLHSEEEAMKWIYEIRDEIRREENDYNA